MIDPVRYEIFCHRLFQILEEGRLAMARVSGSPVVVEGGETVCSFYTADGTPVLTAAGVLLHCTGARDFILKAIEWYEEDPGLHDGDQLFFNDPYIGGQHLPDQIIVKPIFYGGHRIAWSGAFMHTPETGGLEPGGMHPSATDIFQEGIRILGLKVMERGVLRPEVYRTIVEQVRDPYLVGLDLKAKVAANHVCSKGYVRLIEQFGPAFVEQACQKLIADAEALARERLRRLPDGTWRSRLYGDSIGRQERPYKVQCTMTKTGDTITFDYNGSSPQVEGSVNSTLPATWGNLFVVLASQLFWHVPWNGGMIKPVRLIAPEGSVVNCRFPAACSLGVSTSGSLVTATAHECVARLLYAGEVDTDVVSGWKGPAGANPKFAGTDPEGRPIVGTILDSFASGVGATPLRDGVDTGGNMLNPTSNISDVEILELHLPFLYLMRRQAPDSGGFGKYAGGMGPEVIHMVYGTPQLRWGLTGSGRRTPANGGMFGGYPGGTMEALFVQRSNIRQEFASCRVPASREEVEQLQGELCDAPLNSPVRPAQEYDLLYHRMKGGGGYGDPLERDPQQVLRDLRRGAICRRTAELVYGVMVDETMEKVLIDQSEQQRRQLRQERLRQGKRLQ